jgi:maltose O-acetyltransferase
MIETVVEEDVRIGAGAVILPGIVLGRGCMIGAGSVVTKSVMPGTTVMGNPARLYTKNRTDVEAKLDAILQHSLETEGRLLEKWSGEGGR